MTALTPLLDDLVLESHGIDTVLAGLAPDDWDRPTPAAGWSVRDQVSHLAFFDDVSVTAATDPAAFVVERAELLALGDDFPDAVAARYRAMPAQELLGWFRSSRRRLVQRLGTLDAKARMPWFGPDMSVMSCATARLMETWAHGLDVVDALGLERVDTDRIKHVAHLGVSTMRFSFLLRGLPQPQAPVLVRLTAPSGAVWTWGEQGAADRVTGSAVEFCQVVTQRRHLDDTALSVEGPLARQWMSIAQAFAGAPGPGRSAARSIEEEAS